MECYHVFERAEYVFWHMVDCLGEAQSKEDKISAIHEVLLGKKVQAWEDYRTTTITHLRTRTVPLQFRTSADQLPSLYATMPEQNVEAAIAVIQDDFTFYTAMVQKYTELLLQQCFHQEKEDWASRTDLPPWYEKVSFEEALRREQAYSLIIKEQNKF